MPRKPEVKPVAKLGWLLDGEFTVFGPGPNRVAAESTLAKVRELGRVEDVDDAQVTAFVMLAEAVDADPTNAALWGQYRAAEEALRGLGVDGGDDALSKFLAELSAGDRDSAVAEPKDARGKGGKDRGGDRAAVHAVAAGSRRPRGGTAS